MFTSCLSAKSLLESNVAKIHANSQLMQPSEPKALYCANNNISFKKLIAHFQGNMLRHVFKTVLVVVWKIINTKTIDMG